jgi:hypothetical protein
VVIANELDSSGVPASTRTFIWTEGIVAAPKVNTLAAAGVLGDVIGASGFEDTGIVRTGGGSTGSAACVLNASVIRRETASLP